MTPNKSTDIPAADDPLSEETARLLLPDVPEGLPEDAGGTRIRGRMWQTIQRLLHEESTHYVTVRRDEGEWIPLFPLVELKLLQSMGQGASFLLRLQPGAHLPAHDHAATEECLMLEGELDLGQGLVVRAGDYHVAPAGLGHETAVSRTGALIFIRSELPAYQL